MKKAFTLIELVFAIVILGVLVSLAVPRLVGNSDDAQILKAKTQISTIRARIQLYANKNQLSGKQDPYPDLEEASKDGLFSMILDNPIKEKADQKYGWKKNGDKYIFFTPNKTATFSYYKTATTLSEQHIPAGSFICEGELCDILDK